MMRLQKNIIKRRKSNIFLGHEKHIVDEGKIENYSGNYNKKIFTKKIIGFRFQLNFLMSFFLWRMRFQYLHKFFGNLFSDFQRENDGKYRVKS